MNFPYSRTNGDDYINFLLNKFSQKSIFNHTSIDTTSMTSEDNSIKNEDESTSSYNENKNNNKNTNYICEECKLKLINTESYLYNY